jgi:hypothetical protein
MKDNYGKQEMGKSTQMAIDRMARQGGENEVRASEDYNRMMMKEQAKQMKRSAPRKMKR